MNERQYAEAVRHGIADATMGADHSRGVENNYGAEYLSAYQEGQRTFGTAQVVNRHLDEREAV